MSVDHAVASGPRRLVLLSYAFSPSVGGIERVGALVAEGLQARGWAVVVITNTPGDELPGVIRRPGPVALMRALRESDVVLESNLSVRLSWPLMIGIVARPRVTVLHAPLQSASRGGLRHRLKSFTLPRKHTYVVSRFLQSSAAPRARIMPNPYSDDIFVRGPQGSWERRGVVFVGRLVPAKGADVLIRAVAGLRTPTFVTIIGDGPERRNLTELAIALGVDARFLGSMAPVNIAEKLKHHVVLAVPSVSAPPEVFGLVVLEGLASGCRVIASDSGGLPEAVGECGRIVPEADVAALTEALELALSDPAVTRLDEERIDAHLRRFAIPTVMTAYENSLTAALSGDNVREDSGARE